MENCTVILAAGEGKRMKSDLPKVLSRVLFKPMLHWVIDATRGAGVEDICVVTGFRHEVVEDFLHARNSERPGLKPLEYVLQAKRKGTGHAVMMADSFLQRHKGSNVLVLNGDSPFIDSGVIRNALKAHVTRGNSVTVISAEVEDPTGYGRIVRGPSGELRAIVEQKDADAATLRIGEVNSGAYWFNVEDLLLVLSKIQNNNAQGEYYLPDAIKLLIAEKRKAGAFTSPSRDAVLGANDCIQLNELNSIARMAVIRRLMLDGIDFPCLDGVIIGADVTVGPHTSILPGTVLRGATIVGADCEVGPNTYLENCTVGTGCILSSVHGRNASIPDDSAPEPYSILR